MKNIHGWTPTKSSGKESSLHLENYITSVGTKLRCLNIIWQLKQICSQQILGIQLKGRAALTRTWCSRSGQPVINKLLALSQRFAFRNNLVFNPHVNRNQNIVCCCHCPQKEPQHKDKWIYRFCHILCLWTELQLCMQQGKYKKLKEFVNTFYQL